MKKLILLLTLFSLTSCKAQEKLTMHYIEHRYYPTKNKSFVNDELIFLKNKDTLRINAKVPFNSQNGNIINLGIYYNCHLQKDSLYTIQLKKICLKDIPEMQNSYYKVNAVFDKNDCSKFREIENNTSYEYKGNYGMYVDIQGILYEIIGVSPSDMCVFQH